MTELSVPLWNQTGRLRRTNLRSAALAALRIAASGLVAICALRLAHAAPQIADLSMRGLQIGGTTTLSIQGSDLMPAPKLVSDLPINNVVVAEKSTATNVELQVTLDAKVIPGLYNLRVANER